MKSSAMAYSVIGFTLVFLFIGLCAIGIVANNMRPSKVPIHSPTLTYTQQQLTFLPAPTRAPTPGFRDWSAQKRDAVLKQQGLYTPPPTYPLATYPPTPIPYNHVEFALCRQFRKEMAFARSKGWTFENLHGLLTPEELAGTIDMNNHCNKVMSSAYPTSTPQLVATPAPTPRATHSPMVRDISTQIPRPTLTPAPLTQNEVRATLTAHRSEFEQTQTPTPSPPPVPTATPIPFQASDGVSAIPLIDTAFKFASGRVDKDGLPLSREAYANLDMGIVDYYALDFERRCLTERGTIPLFDKALERDFPGHMFMFSESKYRRYIDPSIGGPGDDLIAREGDYALKWVEWWIEHDGKSYNIAIRVDSETCEPIPWQNGKWYDPWEREPGDWRPDPECEIFHPLDASELTGSVADISKRVEHQTTDLGSLILTWDIQGCYRGMPFGIFGFAY